GTEDPPADRRGRTRVFSEAHAHTLAAPGPGSSSGLLLGRLLRGGLLGGRLLRGRLARSALLGPLRTLVREQLDGLVEGDRLDREVPRQGAVGLAVGDVGAETAVLDDDRLARGRVLAELAQRRRRRLTPALLGLGVQREGLLEGDGEHRLLVGQGPRVGALLEVRPVPPVLRRDLLARRRVDAHHAWQREQLEGVLE